MKIKDWWYAYRVCKKYGIKWNPFIKLGDGEYSWSGVVSVNPFDSDFISIFLHEVGHHVHNRKVKLMYFLKATEDELRYTDGYMRDRSIYKTLEAEALASRFAAKTGLASREYLLKAYNTYTARIFRNTTKTVVVNEISKIVDCVYKNSRRIEK